MRAIRMTVTCPDNMGDDALLAQLQKNGLGALGKREDITRHVKFDVENERDPLDHDSTTQFLTRMSDNNYAEELKAKGRTLTYATLPSGQGDGGGMGADRRRELLSASAGGQAVLDDEAKASADATVKKYLASRGIGDPLPPEAPEGMSDAEKSGWEQGRAFARQQLLSRGLEK